MAKFVLKFLSTEIDIKFCTKVFDGDTKSKLNLTIYKLLNDERNLK